MIYVVTLKSEFMARDRREEALSATKRSIGDIGTVLPNSNPIALRVDCDVRLAPELADAVQRYAVVDPLIQFET